MFTEFATGVLYTRYPNQNRVLIAVHLDSWQILNKLLCYQIGMTYLLKFLLNYSASLQHMDSTFFGTFTACFCFKIYRGNALCGCFVFCVYLSMHTVPSTEYQGSPKIPGSHLKSTRVEVLKYPSTSFSPNLFDSQRLPLTEEVSRRNKEGGAGVRV